MLAFFLRLKPKLWAFAVTAAAFIGLYLRNAWLREERDDEEAGRKRAEAGLRRAKTTEIAENEIDEATDTRAAEIAKKLESGEPLTFDPNDWD